MKDEEEVDVRIDARVSAGAGAEEGCLDEPWMELGANPGDDVAGGVELLARRGRMLVVGLMGGSKAEVDLGIILRNRLTIIGTVLRTRSAQERMELARDVADHVLPLLAAGTVRPVIDRVLPFEAVADAHRQMERNDTFGKLVLVW